MDNMGGLLKLFFMEASEFISLLPGQNNLFVLSKKSEASLIEIPFSQESGKITESEEDSDHGTIYNYECSCIIPKCESDNITPFGDSKEKQLLIIGIDDNENIWMTGSPGSYFQITMASTTGQAAADLNSRQLKIRSMLPIPSVFIESPF